MTGQFSIGNAVISVMAALPSMSFQGQLVSGVLRIEDVISSFLPGTELPDLDIPEITGFAFNYQHQSKNVSIEMDLNTDWSLSIPVISSDPLFVLEKLSLKITRLSLNRHGAERSGIQFGIGYNL
ncbi:MAG: hypothetical protein GY862_20705 [Gammaproteobacteria bacterium]|nr:hypothetical protein [Gammaproteobacteria bacterium]